MYAIPCIFCHHTNATPIIQENGYHGKQCNECRLIYISPRPAPHVIANLYGHDQAHLAAQTHIEQSFAKSLHARHTLKLVRPYKQSGELLEIGAGAGHFLHEARKVGFNPHALELNPQQASHIRNHFGIPCLQTELDPTSFGSQQFDVIYHCDVVSHLYDPHAAFKIMHSKLASDGLLVFETGNLADVDHRYFNLIPAFQYPDHLFFFGREHLARLLTQTGFKLIALHDYSIVPQLTLMKAVRSAKRFKKTSIPQQKTAGSYKKPSYLKTLLANGYHYGMHVTRYGLGKYLSTYKRPQTVIVIARKITP